MTQKSLGPQARIALTVAGCFLMAVPAAADTPTEPKPVSEIKRCRALTEPAARLACYDKAVDALTQATEARDVVIVDRQEVRKARKGLFGFTMPAIPFLSGRKDDKQDVADQTRLESVIRSARSLGYGKWRFTLVNDAVWETVEPWAGAVDPEPQLPVVITKGSLGSYFVQTGRGRRSQVRRIQ